MQAIGEMLTQNTSCYSGSRMMSIMTRPRRKAASFSSEEGCDLYDILCHILFFLGLFDVSGCSSRGRVEYTEERSVCAAGEQRIRWSRMGYGEQCGCTRCGEKEKCW